MQLVPQYASLGFAVLPIGDNFTMDAKDAVQAAKFVQCRKIVGVHYDTFGFIKIDHAWAQQLFAEEGMQLFLPAPGESLEL
jgi:L-ascorbate metabolism protein UlaG (beta-lactamase superfamily)